MDDAHLARYAWNYKSVKIKMPFKQKLFSSYISLIVIFLVFTVAVDVIVFYTLPLHYLYPVTFNSSTPPLKVTAILFNGFNPTFTGVNNETKRRIHHGLSLLEDNKVEQLIVAGGNREGVKRKGAQLMADYMLKQGVPAEKILIEASSKDSNSNMEQLGKIVVDHNINTLGLISSPYHLLRLQAMRTLIPFKANIKYYSYKPSNCFPPLTRSEVWYSAHYNALAYITHVILPETLYKKTVMWIREHTEW